ncbi:hypothetical protein AvCA_33070 [Azotobacter vinelandii CA]|uniref:Uncharacterized protein n=2 Tax=Azotobacter vinelandii TaxID=354 RepID=C1DPP1_AZOVD|nr:hypothetical protein Avin_33070 [Azotobacter vinelandii DJ]AGK16367.1 hypothetical protein AvCA_33070 [Azotobacter vinelandii CA]AGK21244.1 hypothetical protein AvCA6_33070 [Azotobacter vinelandii CA6]
MNPVLRRVESRAAFSTASRPMVGNACGSFPPYGPVRAASVGWKTREAVFRRRHRLPFDGKDLRPFSTLRKTHRIERHHDA